MILTSGGTLAHQTAGLEFLLRILTGEPGNYTHYMPMRCPRRS
jgi:hypothetical protein